MFDTGYFNAAPDGEVSPSFQLISRLVAHAGGGAVAKVNNGWCAVALITSIIVSWSHGLSRLEDYLVAL